MTGASDGDAPSPTSTGPVAIAARAESAPAAPGAGSRRPPQRRARRAPPIRPRARSPPATRNKRSPLAARPLRQEAAEAAGAVGAAALEGIDNAAQILGIEARGERAVAVEVVARDRDLPPLRRSSRGDCRGGRRGDWHVVRRDVDKLGGEFVADTRDRDDYRWPAKVGLDLLAQTSHLHVDAAVERLQLAGAPPRSAAYLG